MIASDAHNTTSRGFHLAESYELIEKEFGMNVMSDLKENPYLLISGKRFIKKIQSKFVVRNYLGFLMNVVLSEFTGGNKGNCLHIFISKII